jgi:long-chain acyl-CoA synthetase
VLSAAGKAKSNDEIKASLRDTVEQLNPGLESYEKLEKAVVMTEAWTVENNLMTPTLKVKRNEVEKIHMPKYPMWYQKDGVVVWE